jgi:hypothetical protein
MMLWESTRDGTRLSLLAPCPGGEVIRAAGLSLKAHREDHRGGVSLVTARQRRAVTWLRIPSLTCKEGDTNPAANNAVHRESPLRWPQSLGAIGAKLSPQNQIASETWQGEQRHIRKRFDHELERMQRRLKSEQTAQLVRQASRDPTGAAHRRLRDLLP